MVMMMASGPAPLAAAAAALCPALRARTRAALLLLWPLLLLLLLRSSVSAQELPTNGVNGYSLHPPYFNLAEGTKITATATCGEEEGGRTVHDLYCKLVGGPVSGDPSQTIQVSGTRTLRPSDSHSCCSVVDLYWTLWRQRTN